MMKTKTLFADVYWAKIPSEMGQNVLFPPERQKEIIACGNEKVRRQKYYAWKLLEYALRESLGCEIGDLEFFKGNNGKWTSSSCYFSLSHSHSAVAVAVSDYPIGVDVEKLVPEKAEFLQRVLTEQERAEFALLVGEKSRLEYLFESWTKKESVFKKAGDGSFRPTKIAVDKNFVTTKKVLIDGEEYALSMAAENVTGVRHFVGVELTE